MCADSIGIFYLYLQTLDAGVHTAKNIIDQKMKDTNAFVDATREDLEKVLYE